MSARFLCTPVLLSALSYNLTTATVHCDYHTLPVYFIQLNTPKTFVSNLQCIKYATYFNIILNITMNLENYGPTTVTTGRI